MTELQRRGLERALSIFNTFFSEKRVEVCLLMDDSFVGRTGVSKTKEGKPRPLVEIGVLHPLLLDENQEPDLMCVWGVDIHELLHQIYTDFEMSKTMTDRLPDAKTKNLFRTVANVIEDPAIESSVGGIINPSAYKSMKKLIKKTYEQSPPIEYGLEKVPPEQTIVPQIISALIQVGDCGPVKGKFLTPTAEELFKQILPLFKKGVNSKKAKKRLDISLLFCFKFNTNKF